MLIHSFIMIPSNKVLTLSSQKYEFGAGCPKKMFLAIFVKISILKVKIRFFLMKFLILGKNMCQKAFFCLGVEFQLDSLLKHFFLLS